MATVIATLVDSTKKTTIVRFNESEQKGKKMNDEDMNRIKTIIAKSMYNRAIFLVVF